MSGFESNIMMIQQRLGCRLKPEELRLLQMWDSIMQADARDFATAEEAQPAEEMPAETFYVSRRCH